MVLRYSSVPISVLGSMSSKMFLSKVGPSFWNPPPSTAGTDHWYSVEQSWIIFQLGWSTWPSTHSAIKEDFIQVWKMGQSPGCWVDQLNIARVDCFGSKIHTWPSSTCIENHDFYGYRIGIWEDVTKRFRSICLCIISHWHYRYKLAPTKLRACTCQGISKW